MKIEDAIFYLKNTPVIASNADKETVQKAYDMAIEALEKQIPSGIRFNGDEAVCPKCGAVAEWKRYCDECGQRLVDEYED